MIEPYINILSGPVRSGKTTWLKNSYAGKENVYGILTPIVNGKRVFLHISTGEIFPMEATAEEIETLAVGKYRFSKIGFQKAAAILLEGLRQKDGTLILDEIGPLELNKEGFYEVMKKIISDRNSLLKKIIVVREGLLGNVIYFFGITNFQIIKP